MSKVNAAISTPNQMGGAAFQLLQSGLKTNSLRTNNVLRKQEWQDLDTRLVEIANRRLNGIADLRDAGLTVSLGGLGTTVSQYEALSDMTPADVNMSGVSQGEQDDAQFDLRSVPVPIIHKDFSLNIRRLEASRKLGDSVDLTQGEVAMEKVIEGEESLLFKGSSLQIEGNRIYGYTTHPNRITGTAPGGWSDIKNIYPTVTEMIKDAQVDRQYGPYILYVAGDVWNYLQSRYDDGSGQTALQSLENIRELQSIKPADELEGGELVLVQMNRRTVDLAIAQDVSTIEWDSYGGMQFNFKVMSAMVPRIKPDFDGRLGIVHYTGANAEVE
ncbi:major capsid protein [Desertibacillus haloalkaliphilus]|uniref:major capsid protein n=1 Tax=Desertibacillus haloalkaliphilus TaxID=1328930 RepID=UPI001C277767|nr:family 1 encapsulin nanocompartment shell protein [Desertibacillus haloalkaliphilus]MBU8908512.1 bacteriocin family protein [Desertibacillus haloalkaliphilus]